ncbi:hypothetical protein, partial [Streptomyces canus]|uniref:hypothetical protein n=1 Tax=Streptomyces canus TaxID=58343 RepID=UPI003F4C11B7
MRLWIVDQQSAVAPATTDGADAVVGAAGRGAVEGDRRCGLDAISVGVILRQSGLMTAALVERMAPEELWT